MQEEDALEGFVDNTDGPYDRFFEEPDDQHEQQLFEDYNEEDALQRCHTKCISITWMTSF